MVATSRFKRASQRTIAAKPYTKHISRLLDLLVDRGDEPQHPLMRSNDSVNRVILLVLTSNRGLCGGFNSGMFKLASQQREELLLDEKDVEIWVSGKKGIQHYRFQKEPMARVFTEFDNKTTYASVEALADEFIRLYSQQQIGGVRIVYMRFASGVLQLPDVVPLLPLGEREQDEELEQHKVNLDDYILSPSGDVILQTLIPAAVRAQLYQCVTDAVVSEQAARMNSMKAATENAEQMIDSLNREYNRVRQSQITNGLLDIIGGAEALS